MSRLDRLELVVRNLADRILGEEITFDAIAEQEAAEQGVAYVPPAALAPTEQTGDIEKQLAELRDKIAAFDRRYIEQEKVIQTLITAADALLQRLQTAEGRLDQHRDVINDHYQQNISVLATLSSTARDKLLKVS
jgi:predicted ribosome quality control (RQC) complex YloA/Tae2 family protein